MLDRIKLLIVILTLAASVFAFAKNSASTIMEPADFTRRRNLWFAITFAAFLSPNFWVYAFFAALFLIYTNRRENNPPALFFFILFAMPLNKAQISGLGIFNALFELNYARFLGLLILLPAFLSLSKQNNSFSFGRTPTDKALVAYLLLTITLYLRDTTVTDMLRETFYLFLDVFLPYVVVSRYLKDLQTFRDALFSLVMATMVLALIAVFEFFKNWLLYEPLSTLLQMERGMTGYLMRDGMLRVVASTGQPIVLGYLMVVGIGLYLFLQRTIQNKQMRRLGMLLLIAGLIVPLSRGPWVGAAVLLLVFIATGRNPVRHLMKLALMAMLTLPLIALFPGTERAINLLPFIGTTEKENVEFRERLFTNSMIVIHRNPWFGSTNFIETPEIQATREGQNNVDIVNSYLRLALEKGFVGAGLFIGIFMLALFSIYRSMRLIPDRDSDEYLLGRVLLSTLLTILMMISTVSSISFIPIVYWSIAGMGAAYAQMVRQQNLNRSDSVAT